MSDPDQVWIVDDDKSIRWVLEKALQRGGMSTRAFENGLDVQKALGRARPDAMIVDIRMPGMDGLQLLDVIQQRQADLPVIVMTAHSDLDSAVSAYQGGAFEYLPKPFDVNEVIALVQRACEQGREGGEVPPGELAPTPEIIGEAPAIQEVFRAIGRLSRSNINVLVNGESGTGKELVARALHRHSPRGERPFIALNMAAIPRDLLESELFGHERGAFTGAQSQRRGRFEQANHGTLFLDEIGDMPAELQTRLLRVLAEGEFYRVGGHTPVQVDVRIIAATHQNLEQRVHEGSFREDLFHRLNVIRIQLPALRERRPDIGLLLDHFLRQSALELEVESKILHEEARVFLSSLDWPGNVRQLENLCRWLTVMASSREIRMLDLPAELRRDEVDRSLGTDWEQALQLWANNYLASGERAILKIAMPVFESVLIRSALQQSGGRRRDAARLLGWGRNTLTRKIKELHIEAF